MGSQLRKLRAKAGVAGREQQAELRRRARTRELTVTTGGQAGSAEYSFKVEEPERRRAFEPKDLELSIGGVPFPGLAEVTIARAPMSSPTMPEHRSPSPPRPAPTRRPPIHSLLALAMLAGLTTGGGRRDGY